MQVNSCIMLGKYLHSSVSPLSHLQASSDRNFLGFPSGFAFGISLGADLPAKTPVLEIVETPVQRTYY